MDIIIIGSGGHAKVVKELVEILGHKIIAVCDPNDSNKNHPFWKNIVFHRNESELQKYSKKTVFIANGLGHLPKDNISRKKVFYFLNEMGFSFPALIHPASFVSNNAELYDGVQIMAGSVVQPGCIIKENTIINTSSSLDHDCKIEDNVHIAPGNTLCGSVTVGKNSFIGCGSSVIQSITIKEDTFIKAGSTIIKDII